MPFHALARVRAIYCRVTPPAQIVTGPVAEGSWDSVDCPSAAVSILLKSDCRQLHLLSRMFVTLRIRNLSHRAAGLDRVPSSKPHPDDPLAAVLDLKVPVRSSLRLLMRSRSQCAAECFWNTILPDDPPSSASSQQSHAAFALKGGRDENPFPLSLAGYSSAVSL